VPDASEQLVQRFAAARTGSAVADRIDALIDADRYTVDVKALAVTLGDWLTAGTAYAQPISSSLRGARRRHHPVLRLTGLLSAAR